MQNIMRLSSFEPTKPVFLFNSFEIYFLLIFLSRNPLFSLFLAEIYLIVICKKINIWSDRSLKTNITFFVY